MSAYDIITDRVLREIEAGTIPWHKPWKSAHGEDPCNAVTMRPYSGINRFLCSLAHMARHITVQRVGDRVAIATDSGSEIATRYDGHSQWVFDPWADTDLVLAICEAEDNNR